ncbi:MAG: cytidylate kinase-like family protein [Opitutales bacterium]|nr:cytidylate kinase-like family protein [Opitutales bacterium]
MNAPQSNLNRCHSFVVCHLNDDQKSGRALKYQVPFITIFRQTGAGARSLGQRLQRLLDAKMPIDENQWALFDRNLVQTAMREHGLPERFARYLPEDHVSEIGSLIGELLGLHPPIWELNQDVFETLIHLANLGGVVLVGRGSNIVTRKLNHGFHLRLVAGKETRIKCSANYYRISRKEATDYIEHEDKARYIWVRENFEEDINDPNCYDLCINTDRISVGDAATLVVEEMKRKFPMPAKK